MSTQPIKKTTEDIEIQMIKPKGTPQTANELWNLAGDDLPFLEAWQGRADDLGLTENAMWLAAVYELVVSYKQTKKLRSKISKEGESASGNDSKALATFIKLKDALLKRIADIERREQIMEKDRPMKMLDTEDVGNNEELGGLNI